MDPFNSQLVVTSTYDFVFIPETGVLMLSPASSTMAIVLKPEGGTATAARKRPAPAPPVK